MTRRGRWNSILCVSVCFEKLDLVVGCRLVTFLAISYCCDVLVYLFYTAGRRVHLRAAAYYILCDFSLWRLVDRVVEAATIDACASLLALRLGEGEGFKIAGKLRNFRACLADAVSHRKYGFIPKQVSRK